VNVEEKGAANAILDARKHLKYIHLSERKTGSPTPLCIGGGDFQTAE
jgi:hypothetical protein